MSASFDIFKTLFNNKILQKLNIGNSHSGETIHGYTSQNSILQSNNNRTNKLLFVSYGNIRDINGNNGYYEYKTEPVEITDFWFNFHIGDTSDINKSSLRFEKHYQGKYVNASYRPMIKYLN